MSAGTEATGWDLGIWEGIRKIREGSTGNVNQIKGHDVFYGIAAGKLAKLAALWTSQAEQTKTYHVIPEVAEIVGFSVGLYASCHSREDDTTTSAPPSVS
jgi:hypothetical protein